MTTPRKLDRSLVVFRIGDIDGKFKIFSGQGAASVQGRWHEKGCEVIYTSEHYSTAMLETLAHFNGILPKSQHFIRISIPAGTTYEVVTKDTIPTWALGSSTEARTFGTRWLKSRRSALLFVPSFVAREEQNVLINPRHDEFHAIEPGLETPVYWDDRLLGP